MTYLREAILELVEELELHPWISNPAYTVAHRLRAIVEQTDELDDN